MITKMHIENFKCFKDFDIELGPFNVLVGPNDTGKTAFLQAVSIVSAVAENGMLDIEVFRSKYGIDLKPPIAWNGKGGGEISIKFEASDKKSPIPTMSRIVELFSDKHQIQRHFRIKTSDLISVQKNRQYEPEKLPSALVGKAAYCHFDPAALRKPSPITRPDGTPAEFQMTPTGEGFHTFLEDILRNDRRAFAEMENDFNQRFPVYQIHLAKHRADNILLFKTPELGSLPSQSVSDGTMLYLAFLAVAHQPNPPRILLLEEPENGVHHASLKDIVAMLRHLCEIKGVQVIMTTHSPYLLDLVQPEEVRVFSKDAEGVHAVKLSDYPDVEDMKKHFMSGEIWTTFEEADIVAKARGKGD